MRKESTYNVFLAQRTDDRDSFQIYLSGKETGIYITRHDVMSLLSVVEYGRFCKGELIFEIDKARIDPYLHQRPPADPHKRWQPK